MAGFDIKIEGHDALARAFKALPIKVQRKVLRPALRAGAKVARAAVAAQAPRSDEAPHVADTLKIKAMKRKRGRIGLVVITGKRSELGIKESTDSQRRAYNQRKRLERVMTKQGTSAGGLGVLETLADLKRRDGPGYYPAHIEYGYRKKDGTHVPANPFMKRGLEQSRGPATAAVAAEMSKRMKDLAGTPDVSDQDFFAETDGGEAF